MTYPALSLPPSLPPSGRDDQALEVPRIVGQDLDPAVGHEDGVGVPEAAELGRVEAGLDCEDHPCADLRVVSGVEERSFVVTEPDRVSCVVPPVLPQPVRLEVTANRIVDVRAARARPDRLECHLLERFHVPEEPSLLSIG